MGMLSSVMRALKQREQQVPWSLAFLRATTQRSNRKRLLGVGVG
jgi:hypothetical protein